MSGFATKKPFALSLSKCSLLLSHQKKGRASTSSARTVFGAIAMLLTTPAFAQTVAITGGKVVIGDGSAPIDGGTVVFTNGRVVAAGLPAEVAISKESRTAPYLRQFMR